MPLSRLVPTRLILLALAVGLLVPGLAGCSTPVADESAHVPSLIELQMALAVRRMENLDRLHAYVQGRGFPRNRVAPGFANVFVDEDGKHCAVANLMRLDGETDLIAQTARDNNLVVLAQIEDGPLLDWMQASGFTRDEIARIQEPYFEFDPNDPNFVQNEDDRLVDTLTQVEQELRANSARSILDAARAQREAILAQYDSE